MSFPSTSDNEELFEKDRGQKRYLEKKHQKRKDALYNKMKDQALIRKTIESSNPIGKIATQKVLNNTTDGYNLNVYYSMNKKNRWKDVNNVNLLKCVSTDVKTEVVERSLLDEDDRKVFAVYSKINENQDDPEKFEIRSATSSGAAQNYSNFLPESRELSEKKSKKHEATTQERADEPIVTYNIHKVHPREKIVDGQSFGSKSCSKTGKNRGTKKLDYEEFNDVSKESEQSESDGEDEIANTCAKNFNLGQFLIDNSKLKQQRSYIKRLNLSMKPKRSAAVDNDFENLFNVHEFLRKTPHTFYKSESIKFSKSKNIDLKQVAEYLSEHTNAKVKFLKKDQLLIDATNLNSTEKVAYGRTSIAIVVSKISSSKLHFIINSIMPTNPDKQNVDYLDFLIGFSTSVYDAIYTICADFEFSRMAVEDMKTYFTVFNAMPLREMIENNDFWNQYRRKLNFHADNENARWTCCTETMSVGVKQEWDHICEMVRETNIHHDYTSPNETMKKLRITQCSECFEPRLTIEIYEVVGGAKKCRDCLKNKFYQDFSAERFPIDLEIIDSTGSSLNSFDYLPAIVPLPLLNLYTQRVFVSSYNDLDGATGVFENCPNCESLLHFEEQSANMDKSCFCGFCWCSKCKSAPHWPMTCDQFSLWNEKWRLRYDFCKTEGNGNDTFVKSTCEYNCGLITLKLPTEDGTAECPECRRFLNVKLLESAMKEPSKNWVARCFENPLTYMTWRAMNPMFFGHIKIQGIFDFHINKSVVKICKNARTLRFDEKIHKTLLMEEIELVKSKTLQPYELENIMGSIHYLVENVSAWMFMSNKLDKNLESLLEGLLEKRHELWSRIQLHGKKPIKPFIKKIREDIGLIISTVSSGA